MPVFSPEPDIFNLGAIKPGVSVMCGVRNRATPLKYSLPSWMDIDTIDQIVLVDFGSTVPLTVSAGIQPNEKLRIVRCDNLDGWAASRAINLAFHFARHEYVFRVDADIVLNWHHFNNPANLTPAYGSFYAGNYRTAATENEAHTNGNFTIHRNHFWEQGGYDERIITYGWEDDDLFDRWVDSGINRNDFGPGALHHLHHDDWERTRNSRKPGVNCEKEIHVNRRAVAARTPWSLAEPRQQYRMTVADPASNYFQVSKV